MNAKSPKTKRGAVRQYNAIIRELYRRGKGGTKFGIDMPTMRVVWPEFYSKVVELRAIYNTLPE